MNSKLLAEPEPSSLLERKTETPWCLWLRPCRLGPSANDHPHLSVLSGFMAEENEDVRFKKRWSFWRKAN
jgi:hypothetical protein